MGNQLILGIWEFWRETERGLEFEFRTGDDEGDSRNWNNNYILTIGQIEVRERPNSNGD